jgi:hypothetical protein
MAAHATAGRKPQARVLADGLQVQKARSANGAGHGCIVRKSVRQQAYRLRLSMAVAACTCVDIAIEGAIAAWRVK